MPSQEWVLDTEILEIASAGDHPQSLAAVSLLHSILVHHALAVDPEGQILAEYERHLRRGSHAQQWWQQMTIKGRIAKRSHRLKNVDERALGHLRFDRDDWKFVGVAAKTPSHLLVAEESDYWAPAVAAFLANNMSIVLLRVAEAAARATS